MKRFLITLMSGAPMALLAISTPGWAQAAPANSASAGDATTAGEGTDSSGDIIVTARRRSERLQDVPLAITTFGGKQLQLGNIVRASDLTGSVPSLVVTSSGFGSGTSTPNFAIRGLTAQEPSMLTDPAVTVYVNDVPIPRMQGLNLAFFDLAAIEVAKGPQGTLFGRNTTGGAVLVRPNQPVDHFEGAAGIDYSSFSTAQLNGMINIPLASGVSLRVAAQGLTSNGYILDTLLHSHPDTKDEVAIRAGLSAQISDGLKNITFFTFTHADDGGGAGKLVGVNPASPFNTPATRAALGYTDPFEVVLARAQALGPYKVESGLPSFDRSDSWMIDNTTTFDLSDNLHIKNIFAYRQLQIDYINDMDGMPYPLLHILNRMDQKQVSEELQLQGNYPWVNFVVGGFFFREHGLTTNGWSKSGLPDAGIIERTDIDTIPGAQVSQARVANRSLAVFGQATIKLDRFVRGLSATLGARMNWDNRYRALLNRTLVDGAPALCKFTLDTDGNPATPEIRPDITNCILPGRKSFSKPTYNLGVDYKIDPDHLVYFAHRHGYRSGGLDIRANSSATNEIGYRPEIVDDLEVGIKADWHFGNKYLLRTNLAAYQSSFKDIQRIVLIPGSIPPVNLTTNAAKGRIRGFEAEATLRTGPLFELTGFYSYTDAKYLNYVTPLGQDLSGFPFALAPKNIYGATVHVNIPMDDKIGHPYLHAKYSHSDGYSDFDVQDIFSFIKGSDVVDLTIGMEKVGGSGLDVAFYVRNLFDEVYYTPWYHNVTLGFGTQHPEMPRSFGVRAQYKF